MPLGNRARTWQVRQRRRGPIRISAGSYWRSWLPAIGGALLIVACKEPPDQRYVPDAQAQARGLAVIERVGCGACHEIPGLDWPEGRTGPSLQGFDGFGLLAGELPNTIENLAGLVRNAPSAKPGSTMPAMPISEAESYDVAAYLYGMNDD